MNGPEAKITFVPKQAISPTPQLYDELVSDSMEQLAAASLTSAQPVSDGSVFHDNGCGTGAATEAIMQSMAARSEQFTIKATDINDDALKAYKERAVKGSWPAEASNMNSNALSFGDNTFTHSIGNAMIFTLGNDGIDAVREAYRTLKPGGKAVFNCWAYVPNIQPLEEAVKATRPEGSPLPRMGMEKWYDPAFLRNVMQQGGFKPSNIILEQVPLFVKFSDIHHFATMLWSFIGGTTAVGWLELDEEHWDQAVEVIKANLRKTDGFQDFQDGTFQLRFLSNIAIGTK